MFIQCIQDATMPKHVYENLLKLKNIWLQDVTYEIINYFIQDYG